MSTEAPQRHALVIEWNGEHGEESSSTGYCRCGWNESCSSQAEVRREYRGHRKAVDGRPFGITDAASARYAEKLFADKLTPKRRGKKR